MSQTEMAKQPGISQPTLNRLENAGQNTTLKTLSQLCRALRCEVGDRFQTGHVKLPAARAGVRRPRGARLAGRSPPGGVESASAGRPRIKEAD
jgi:DNA-binding XRE family transcriptional regulator